MVLGAILSAIFGAVVGYVAGWVVQLFPGFNNSLTGGVYMITGIDVSGQTQVLFTGIGFILGLLAGIVQIISKSNKK